MQARQPIRLIISISMLFLFGSVALAQTYTPDVQVAEMGVVDGVVNIAQATVTGPAWVVIHANNDGKPGAVIGYAPLTEGVNTDVAVDVDIDAVTPIMHAMLHVDEGEEGVYEFPGVDEPVKIGDAIVMARFSATPVVAEEEASNAPASVPATGAGPSTPLIFTVMVAVLLVLGTGVVVSRRVHA